MEIKHILFFFKRNRRSGLPSLKYFKPPLPSRKPYDNDAHDFSVKTIETTVLGTFMINIFERTLRFIVWSLLIHIQLFCLSPQPLPIPPNSGLIVVSFPGLFFKINLKCKRSLEGFFPTVQRPSKDDLVSVASKVMGELLFTVPSKQFRLGTWSWRRIPWHKGTFQWDRYKQPVGQTRYWKKWEVFHCEWNPGVGFNP